MPVSLLLESFLIHLKKGKKATLLKVGSRGAIDLLRGNMFDDYMHILVILT